MTRSGSNRHKQRARALAEQTGLSYAAARHLTHGNTMTAITPTVPGQPPAPVRAPSPQEIAAAIDVLRRAYTPDDLTLDPDEDWLDETGGCDCGGTWDDEEGGLQPYCNCGDGCYCPPCMAPRHLALSTCSVRDCGKRSRLKVTRTRPQGSTVLISADADDPARDDRGHVGFPRPALAGPGWHVCGTVHARQVIDQNSADGTEYVWDVESYRWQPEITNLRPVTASVVHDADLIRYTVESLASADYDEHHRTAVKEARYLAEQLTRTLHALHRYQDDLATKVDD